MDAISNNFGTIEATITQYRFGSPAQAVMGEAALVPVEIWDLELIDTKRSIFVPEMRVTRSNVELWANQLLLMIATGLADQVVFCVPHNISNRIAVKLMAMSNSVRVCAHETTLIIYYGAKGELFNSCFSLYGVIH